MSEPIRFDDFRALSGAATHTGLHRATNEDSFLAASPVFLVADGMGGHEAGEVASALAVDTFARFTGSASVDHPTLRDAFDLADAGIARIGSQAGPRRAGTTVSGVAITDNGGRAYWLVFNVGDSRTYRFANSVLEQISVDHSVLQELIDDGDIAEADADSYQGRNVITRALGAGTRVRPDYWLIPIEGGDRILICSDGVSGELDRSVIARVLAEEADPQDAAVRLVHEGILRGGHDNLTAVIVDALDVSTDHVDVPGIALPGIELPGIDFDTRPRGHAMAGGQD